MNIIRINGKEFPFFTHQKSKHSTVKSVHVVTFTGHKRQSEIYEAINATDDGKARIVINNILATRNSAVHLEINDNDNSVIEFIGK